MFVISFKTGKRKIVLALAVTLVALTAVLVAARVSSHSMSGLPAGETNEERLSFLASWGWQAEEEPLEMREVLIPAEFDDVYLRYNEVQIAQGMDLRPFAGRTCSQWVYRVTNHPSGREVRASLLVLDGHIVGGDLSTAELGGFLTGFSGEGGEQAQTASEPAQSPEPAPGELPAQTASEPAQGAEQTPGEQSAQSTEPAEAASEQAQSAA